MGQKVHPKGFRLGIYRDHDARWFARGANYGDYRLEDLAIRDFLNQVDGIMLVTDTENELSMEFYKKLGFELDQILRYNSRYDVFYIDHDKMKENKEINTVFD